MSSLKNQVLNSAVLPAIAPTDIQRPIQINDAVTISNPGSKYHGKRAVVTRLKTEKLYGQELQKADVNVLGEKRYIEVQLSWLSRIGSDRNE